MLCSGILFPFLGFKCGMVKRRKCLGTVTMPGNHVYSISEGKFTELSKYSEAACGAVSSQSKQAVAHPAQACINSVLLGEVRVGAWRVGEGLRADW